jgi:hypothetical protein
MTIKQVNILKVNDISQDKLLKEAVKGGRKRSRVLQFARFVKMAGLAFRAHCIRIAQIVGPKNIRVNSINPGMVVTEGTEITGILTSDFRLNTETQTPLGKRIFA